MLGLRVPINCRLIKATRQKRFLRHQTYRAYDPVPVVAMMWRQVNRDVDNERCSTESAVRHLVRFTENN